VVAVVVDVTGSVALGGAAGRRIIPGIGASRRSSFLQPGTYHHAVLVDDIDAIAVCRIVREDLCLTLGGSSGCCIRALLADLAVGRLAVGRGNGFSVCLAADGGTKYLDTLYSDDWAVAQGIHEELTDAITRFRYEGLSFTWEPTAS
jgi:cysteine synthase A